MAAPDDRPPRVLISYTHDSDQHEAAMLALCDRLRHDGVDCTIDQYETSPPEGWPRWMLREVRDADFVLCVCTPSYNRRVLGEEAPGVGLGATWEGAAILNELYLSGAHNTKFIPILVDPTHTVEIPPLQGAMHYRPVDDAGYEALYRLLTNQPAVVPPPLGQRVPLPARERRPDYRYPSRIPIQLTPLIGRERETTELSQLLDQVGTRLVTLHGPGGVGKSRLAFEAAAYGMTQFRDGAVVVDLGAIRDASQVGPAFAEALDIREEAGIAIEETLQTRLAVREQLIVLDTAEHVVEQAAALVAQLLACCPRVQFLVTSRETLRLREELVYEVLPLALPPQNDEPYSAEGLAGVGSVALFIDRARTVAPDFELSDRDAPAIADIVRRLDGLPLAIELAATWMDTLSAEELLERLRPRLPMLIDGPRDLPQRQQTMRDAIAWSYDLLNATEQRVFRDASTFVGDFSVGAAESVLRSTGLDGADIDRALRALRRKSLLSGTTAPGTNARLRMLDMIREFALGERDAQEERADLERAHATYFEVWLFELTRPLEGTPTRVWLDTIEADYPNVRAALEWSRSLPDERLLMRLAWSLWRFWVARGYLHEGRYWLERAIETGGLADPLIYPDLLLGAGELARMQGDYRSARAHFEESARVARATRVTIQEASALLAQATVHYDQGAFDDAIEDWEHAIRLFEQLDGDEAELGVAKARAGIGGVALDRADRRRARDLLEPACEIFRRPGTAGDPIALASALGQLARLAQEEHRLNDAAQLIGESLSILTALADARGLSHRLLVAASIAQSAGDSATAVRYRADARQLASMLGSRQGVALAQHEQALRNPGLTREERMALAGENMATFHELDEVHGIVESAELFASLIMTDNPSLSLELLSAADTLRSQINVRRFEDYQNAFLQRLDVLQTMLGEDFEEIRRSGQGRDRAWIVNTVVGDVR